MPQTHVVSVNDLPDGKGQRWHNIHGSDGVTWSAFGDIRKAVLIDNPGSFDPGFSFGMDCAPGLEGDLHLCDINGVGKLLHTIRHPDGSWDQFIDVRDRVLFDNPANPAPFEEFSVVALAQVRRSAALTLGFPIANPLPELHLCARQGDVNLFHTIRHEEEGQWEPFGDVRAEILAEHPESEDPGGFTWISCDGALVDDLHVCGVGADRNLWYTLRHGDDGSWDPFRNIRELVKMQFPASPLPDVGSIEPFFGTVGVATVQGNLHVCAIGDFKDTQVLWHTMLSPDGTWSPFVRVTDAIVQQTPGAFAPDFIGAVDCTGVGNQLHIYCLSDVDMLLTVLSPPFTWSPFENVGRSVKMQNPDAANQPNLGDHPFDTVNVASI